MNGSERVKLSKVVEKMQLENMTPQIDISGTWLHIPEVNRPALQLTGFYNQFDNDRLQIIGNVEYSYLKSLSETERYERYMQLLLRPQGLLGTLELLGQARIRLERNVNMTLFTAWLSSALREQKYK